jgi:uncharacterized membrane protein
MKAFTPLSLLLFLVLLVLLPLLFTELMAASLVKLHLSLGAAIFVTLSIIVGGMINIPVKRVEHARIVSQHPLSLFGLDDFMPQLRRARRETIIAVNLGGCVIPAALAVYELLTLAAYAPDALIAAAIACAVNILICYSLARPVPGVGILIPGLVPALGAAVLALVLAPHDAAPPVAFVAGVAGPLIGADLLHLKDIEASATGIASIGGAGTFDGIVLSGIVAAYLA